MAISSNATGLRPGVVTSTTRPTNPYTGQLIFETDTFALKFWTGSAWQGAVSAPAGTVNSYAGSTAPTGWLLCAGQAVSRTTYADLFSVVSTTYGSGDGSTTFNLPDLRGRVVAGEDDMGGTAANRLTAGNSGITGTTLGAAGGDERYHQHSHTNTATFSGTSVTSGSESSHTHANSLGSNTVAAASHRHDFKIALNDNYYSATGSNAAMLNAGAYRYSSSSYAGGTAEANITDTRRDATSASAGASVRFTSVGDTTQSSNQTVTISNASGSPHNHSVTAAGTVTMSNANAGSGSSQNVQPTMILNYIIKF